MLGLARRYAGLPGVPAAGEVAAFCASSEWIDVLQEIKRQYVPPRVAQAQGTGRRHGFSLAGPGTRRGELDGLVPGRGRRSRANRVRGAEDGAAGAALQRGRRAATLAVRNWVNEHSAELPTVAELSGPA